MENASFFFSEIHRGEAGWYDSGIKVLSIWRVWIYFPGRAKQCQKMNKMVNISGMLSLFSLKFTGKMEASMAMRMEVVPYEGKQFVSRKGQKVSKKCTKGVISQECFYIFT